MPTWVKERPKGKYFIYYTGIGQTAGSLQEARKQAISDVLIAINQEGSIRVRSKVTSTLQEKSRENKEGIDYIIESEVVQDILIQGETSLIEGLQRVEDYWREKRTPSGSEYQYWVLMRLPKPGYEDINVPLYSYSYGFAPVWRSVMVPGWGQFYKGEKKKGLRLLGSEAALASAFFISQHFSSEYSRKASNERDTDRRKFYNDWSNRSYTISAISGIMAGVVYFFNIFDAITAQGEKRYAYQSGIYIRGELTTPVLCLTVDF